MLARHVFLTLIAVCSSVFAFAGTEEVRVSKVMDDKAIIIRSNGDTYLIEKGVGCLSLRRYEGKKALVYSPGIFLGVGSKLLLPDADQSCRIWNSELLGTDTGSRAVPTITLPGARSNPQANRNQFDTSQVRTLQRALQLVGEKPGPVTGTLSQQTLDALNSFRAKRGRDNSASGINYTLLDLSMAVLNVKPVTDETLAISKAVLNLATHSSGRGGSGGSCEDGHFIRSVSSGGEVIVLDDGSVWEVESVDQVDSSLWLATDDVLVCSGYLIHTDDGEKVSVTRLK